MNPRGYDFYNPERELKMYAFQNGKTPKVVSMPTSDFYNQGGILGNLSYEKQISYRLYNLSYKSGKPQLREYNLKNLFVEQLLPDTNFENGAHFFMASGSNNTEGYLVLGDDVLNSLGSNSLWKINVCRQANDDLILSPLNDTLCSGSYLEVSLDRPQSAKEVFVKLNEEKILISSISDGTTGNLFFKLDAPEGTNVISYWIMDECKEVFISSHLVTLKGSSSISGIKSAKLDTHTNIRYTCEGGPFDSYFWTVTGAEFFTGQGTPSIDVSWGDALSGLVKVEVSDSN
jgi:hypothetical protein